MFPNGEITIKWKVLILAEERSVATGEFCRSTSDERNLGEYLAWGGTSISGCRVPPPYLSLLYQSTSAALAINKKISKKEEAKHCFPAARYTCVPYPHLYLGHLFTWSPTIIINTVVGDLSHLGVHSRLGDNWGKITIRSSIIFIQYYGGTIGNRTKHC